jgi:hypothetical protein
LSSSSLNFRAVILSAAAALAAASAGAASAPVRVVASIPAQEAEIPADFVGMSWETRTLTRSRDLSAAAAGRRIFQPSDRELLTLFRNLGVRHLRVGGGSVDWPATSPIPNREGIDDLFAFVRAAGVRKVIYSFRLLESEPNVRYADDDAKAAKYIWDHDRDCLEAFAIGNEPDRGATYRNDRSIHSVAAYVERWRQVAAAIRSEVQQARFAGPDAGSGNVSWTVGFANAEMNSGLVSVVTEHLYAGGAGKGLSPERGIADMLSGVALATYQRLYERMAVPVLADAFPYRFTEANDHYSGGVTGASNRFAGALWVLEFLHWWAAHGAVGVDVHNTDWVVNDSISPGPDGALVAGPKCDGIRAFALGSRGRPGSADVANPEHLNLSIFVVGGAGHAFVTVINKEYGSGARAAGLTLKIAGFSARAAKTIFLLPGPGPEADAAAATTATLGGEPISAQAAWQGRWTALPLAPTGEVRLTVPATSAAVIELPESAQPG